MLKITFTNDFYESILYAFMSNRGSEGGGLCTDVGMDYIFNGIDEYTGHVIVGTEGKGADYFAIAKIFEDIGRKMN